MAAQIAGMCSQPLETTVMGAASCLFLSEAFSLQLASVLTSFWCYWSLNTTVVVYIER
jgi:hypothetical protein